MEKILSLGLTGKKLLVQGFLFVLLGLILMVTGTWLPVTVIRLVLFLAWIATVLDLVLRIFKKSQSTDTLGVALVKLLVLGYLLGSNLATDVPIYILALVIGVYQIFHASINLVTYVLYRKNKIRPRFRLLLDGLVLVFLGGTSLLSSTGNSVFQLFVLGAYFFLYGVSNIRDGFLFEEEIGKNHLKRRERELARKEVFGEPQLLEFENLQISCHANPDEYLTKIYGDYMQLPKEAERKGHFESTWGD